MQRPTPLDEEIPLDPKEMLVSKTDTKGVITYANDVFKKVCGYSDEELIGTPHNIVRHPDMPKIAFKLMWDRIQDGKNFKAIVKNLAKDGRYYWVYTNFEHIYDPATGELLGYTAYRCPAPRKAIETMTPIYKLLCEEESKSGMDGSYKVLKGYLESSKTNYDDFVNSLVNSCGWCQKIKNKFSWLFGHK